MSAKLKFTPSPQFEATYDRARPALPGQNLDWLASLRQQGMAQFKGTGLPTPALEEWKFTSLKDVANTDYAAPSRPLVEHAAIKDELLFLYKLPAEGPRLIFVNGVFDEDLSSALTDLPDGVMLMPLSQAMDTAPEKLKNHLQDVEVAAYPLLGLNLAMMSEGVFLHVAEGAAVFDAIVVAHIFTQQVAPFQTHIHNVFAVDKGATGKLVEVYQGQNNAAYLTNVATDIQVADGAKMHHLTIQQESAEGVHLSLRQVEMGAMAHFEGFNFNTGAKVLRNETHVRMAGVDSECRINGGFLLSDKRHADTTICVTHEAENCKSMQMCKTMLDGASKGVFQGKTHVRPKAQKTDGYQLNNNLLLSRKAQIDIKPELEIYADDVKCSHGATTGELEGEAMFYLMSRGIPKVQAQQMLVEGFMGEVVDTVSLEGLRLFFKNQVSEWMAKRSHV